jgi:hypothetical protein
MVACGGGGARPAPLAPAAPCPVCPAAAAAATPATPASAAETQPSPAAAVAIPGGVLTVTVLPKPAYIERSDSAQLVNCDLRIENGTGLPWELTAIEVSVLDRAGALAWRKRIDDGGVSPGITVVPNRALPAGGQVLLLNPIHTFSGALDLATLRFELTFQGADRKTVTATAEVAPAAYAGHARLRLPVAGRLLVWDGHDFLSHHRRWDYVFEPIRAMGFDSNAARYSYDLVTVDAAGAMFHGDEADNASWFSFGQPVLAPAAGKVVAVVSGEPDDRRFDMARLAQSLLVVYGNHILIDHGHGEISMLAHLQQGSATVKVGDPVAAGQMIAKMGASGSAMFPHLHYQLQTTADGHAEGLPSYFHDFARLHGARRVAVKRGQIDSGDLVDSKAPRRAR